MKTLIAALLASAFLATPASATVLTSLLHVDNGYEVFVSTSDNTQGTSFGSGNNWPAGFVNNTTLTAGQDYYLHIFAYDQGGIAGLLGQFSLSSTDHVFANGFQTLLTNTTDFKGNNVGFNGSYTAVGDLGANGSGPWGFQGDVNGSARWVWSGDAHNNNAAYFSTKITAAVSNDVPEPATLALFGLGLVGVAALRRKR